MNIKNKLSFLSNYTIDLALVGENEIPYFIEPNPFGKYYSAGSALFSWIDDEEKLHSSDFI